MIQELTATPELNKSYLGRVERITDFGAFIEIMPGVDGLLHVSEIAQLSRQGRARRAEGRRADHGQGDQHRSVRQGPPEPQGAARRPTKAPRRAIRVPCTTARSTAGGGHGGRRDRGRRPRAAAGPRATTPLIDGQTGAFASLTDRESPLAPIGSSGAPPDRPTGRRVSIVRRVPWSRLPARRRRASRRICSLLAACCIAAVAGGVVARRAKQTDFAVVGRQIRLHGLRQRRGGDSRHAGRPRPHHVLDRGHPAQLHDRRRPLPHHAARRARQAAVRSTSAPTSPGRFRVLLQPDDRRRAARRCRAR